MLEWLSGLAALSTLSDRLAGQLEFWREYEGERIRIVQYELERGEDGFQQTRHGVEGTIEDVMSHPPGFMLVDVSEFVATSDFHQLHGLGSTRPQGVAEGPQSSLKTREIDRKFVSFRSIDELEFVEDAEEAIEPFREEAESETDEAE